MTSYTIAHSGEQVGVLSGENVGSPFFNPKTGKPVLVPKGSLLRHERSSNIYRVAVNAKCLREGGTVSEWLVDVDNDRRVPVEEMENQRFTVLSVSNEFSGFSG